MNGVSVTREFPNPSMDRRRLLRTGGLALSLGAIVAACGEDRSGLTNPGRVGNAPPGSTLPEGIVDDLALLRTAQSLEYVALEVYETVGTLNVLDDTQTAVVERFVADHTRHAAAIGELITAEGGEEYACANPWIMSRVVAPAVEAIAGSDDVLRDVLNFAFALETLAAQTYQAVVESLTTPELRKAAMEIGADENRHAAVLAIAITGAPEAYVSPAVLGEPVATDEEGFPIPYAIPAQFGQLGGIPVVVGALDEEGSRTEVTLQTPAENTFVYDFMSC